MIGILLISENEAGGQWIKSITRLMGVQKSLDALVLSPGMSQEEMTHSIENSLKDFQTAEMLILTDIWGSTQCRSCLPFLKRGKIEMMTGYSLPMLLKILSLRQEIHLNKLVPLIKEYGASHIWHIENAKDCPKA